MKELMRNSSYFIDLIVIISNDNQAINMKLKLMPNR